MLYQHLVSDHDCRKRVSQSNLFDGISTIMIKIHGTTCVHHTSKDNKKSKVTNTNKHNHTLTYKTQDTEIPYHENWSGGFYGQLTLPTHPPELHNHVLNISG